MKDKTADALVAKVAARLKARREELGMSANHLAQVSGMSHMGILQIEKGERSPHLRNVFKIASGLELDIQELFARLEA